MDVEKLNHEAHTLATWRDLAGKYARLAFAQELHLREALDTGTYDLEDYSMEVGIDFIAITTKEQA